MRNTEDPKQVYRQAVLRGLAKYGRAGLPAADHPHLHNPELSARELTADEETRRGVAMLLHDMPGRQEAPPEPERDPGPPHPFDF